jgi:hypothetical protein
MTKSFSVNTIGNQEQLKLPSVKKAARADMKF